VHGPLHCKRDVRQVLRKGSGEVVGIKNEEQLSLLYCELESTATCLQGCANKNHHLSRHKGVGIDLLRKISEK
jgi:hypothetical protein